MNRRWAPTTRALVYAFLVDRDGPGCVKCHAVPTADPLEIDHLDPDGPDLPPNLRLLCKTCNLERRRLSKERGTVRESNDQSAGQLSLDSLFQRSATDEAKRGLDYGSGSAEMKANGWFEGNYRAWVLDRTPIARTDAVNGGAEAVGCSPETAARYLAKLTSITGPLVQEQDAHSVMTIRRRNDSP